MAHEVGKKVAGEKAAALIEDGMIVGLGTGSTSFFFIQALIERYKKGLKIEATVASSRHSADIAKQGGLPVIDINSAPYIDITVDSADEIDLQKRMIKGGGGAHVREKILANASNELVVIVDETKLVHLLGKSKLPVEILFYGSPMTRMHLEEMGFQGKWRMNEDGTLFITENGNLIFDIFFSSLLSNPETEHLKIIQVPGVVDTGFFFNLADRVIVGYESGKIEIRE